MLNPLLPARADNGYGGHRLALWLLGVVLFVKATQGVMSIVNGYSVATGADGIPLDSFGPAVAQRFLSMLAVLGLAVVIICLIGLVVLVRYRRLVPLMFALLVMDYVGRRAIYHFIPVVRIGTPIGVYMNLAMFVLTLAGLGLSLWPVPARAPRAAASGQAGKAM